MKWDALPDKSEWLLKRITGDTKEATGDKALDQLAEKLQGKGYVRKKLCEQERFDYLKAYEEVVHAKRRRISRGLLKIVATVIVLIGTGTYSYFRPYSRQAVLRDDIVVGEVQPGGRKAFLIKHDGQEVELGGDTGRINEQNGIYIHIDSTGLRYEAGSTRQADERLYNTLIVPRGGEYMLTLCDGTKVWLNSDSELKYPIRFSGETREVFVSGEAYFEVTKQAGKPFVVKTTLGNITVLGTEFNVCSYPEKEKWVTTLVKGEVSCSLPNGENIILSPRQQLSVKKNREHESKLVNTIYFTCWKEGIFLFEEMRLEDILEQLARWYDIHVFYTNEEVKNLHFSGDLSRFKSFDTFIEMFEKSSEAKLTLKGKNLIVGI